MRAVTHDAFMADMFKSWQIYTSYAGIVIPMTAREHAYALINMLFHLYTH